MQVDFSKVYFCDVLPPFKASIVLLFNHFIHYFDDDNEIYDRNDIIQGSRLSPIPL